MFKIVYSRDLNGANFFADIFKSCCGILNIIFHKKNFPGYHKTKTRKRRVFNKTILFM